MICFLKAANAEWLEIAVTIEMTVPDCDHVAVQLVSEEENSGESRSEAGHANNRRLDRATELQLQRLLFVLAVIDHDEVQVGVFRQRQAASEVAIVRLPAVVEAALRKES